MESILPGSSLERTWKGKGFLDEASPKGTLPKNQYGQRGIRTPGTVVLPLSRRTLSTTQTSALSWEDILSTLRNGTSKVGMFSNHPSILAKDKDLMKGETLPATPPESKTPSTPSQRWNHRFLGWDSPPKMDLRPSPPRLPKECWHGLPLE